MADYHIVGDAAQMQQDRPCKWHKKGAPEQLLIAAAKLSGAQMSALALLIVNSSMKNQFVMPCCSDRFASGVLEILFCEYTRFYVICFPLIGVIVALIVTARMILQRRMYYEMLRLRVGLLDFERGEPLRDPVILGGVWCMAHALLHLLIKVAASAGHHGVTATLESAFKNVTSANSSVAAVTAMHIGHVVTSVESEEPTFLRLVKGFVMPTVFFLTFLAKSYSIQDDLVSLHQYLDEDPQSAQQTISRLHFLSETSLAQTARSGLHLNGRGSETDALQELVQRTAGFPQDGSTERGAGFARKMAHLRSQLILQLWPAKVLLDRRLLDEESRSFRKAWLLFIWPAYFVMAGCIVILFYKALVTLSHIFGMPSLTIQKVNLAGGMHLYQRVQCPGNLIFGKFLGFFVIVGHILAAVWFVSNLRSEVRPLDAAGIARSEAAAFQTSHREAAGDISLVSLHTTDNSAPQRSGQEIVLSDWQGLTAVTSSDP
mmetsp:Transcript_109606/g.172837  ORF Transcript_109606/g.172837 Transcript_109606/m.172837 type:complete len:488 (-) Transcript_109606:75-1538(-)